MSNGSRTGLKDMIIVAGHLIVGASDREPFIADCASAVAAARKTDGCLDFAVSADVVDPQRVNVFERWQSLDALKDFRGRGPDTQTQRRILSSHVTEYEVR
jgi:quinol monooxygenase YgiN